MSQTHLYTHAHAPRAKWYRGAALVADRNARPSDPITLDKGGERTGTTTRATLTHGDTMLTAMFSGRHKVDTDTQVSFSVGVTGVRDGLYFFPHADNRTLLPTHAIRARTRVLLWGSQA